MFPICSFGGGRAVFFGGRVKASAALRMGDHNVSIDQGIRRRALEAVVKTRLIKLELPFGVGPSASPSRFVDFGPHGVASLPPDPSEGIPQRMMAADDQSANLAHERVETVGIQRLRTLTSRGLGFGCAGEIAPALVFAPLASALEVEGGPEVEARADLVLEVREPSGLPRRRRQDPSTSTSAPTGPETRPRRIRQRERERERECESSKPNIEKQRKEIARK